MVCVEKICMIPIFVINLSKDLERRAFMKSQLERLQLPFEFINGFYGDDKIVLESCDDALAVKEHGKVLMKGEKGCAYSHRYVYEKMLREDAPCALILEDDAVLPDDFRAVLQRELGKKRAWEWLSFDYPRIGPAFLKAWMIASNKEMKKKKSFFFYALMKFPFICALSLLEWIRDMFARALPMFSGPKLFFRPLYNAGAYLITQEGIRKMKPLLYPIRFSADRTPNQARVKTGLKMRWYVPLIVRQHDGKDGFASNTIV
jgi:GR25 family glycosyltransferase involved in LPS biosynthesis